MAKNKKPNTTPHGADILKAIKESDEGLTAAELGVPLAVMKALEASEQVENGGTRKTGNRGRPPVVWVIKGNDAQAKRLAAMKAGRERKHEKRVQVGIDRVIAYREWLAREATWNQTSPEIREELGMNRPGIMPEVNDVDYALAREAGAIERSA